MKYYKNSKNEVYAFEDNATPEIIAKVEVTHNTNLTKITASQYNALIAPTFAELQTAKLQDLETSYNKANELDIAYMATTFQADKNSQDLVVKVLSAGSAPSGFFWLDKANNQVAMTYVQLQGLSGAILTRNQTNFIKFQGLKSQVKLAKTQADLDLIVW